MPDVITYNTVISACAKRGDMERLERWLARMEEENVVPNAITYTSVISACAKGGDVERNRMLAVKAICLPLLPRAASSPKMVKAPAGKEGRRKKGSRILSILP